MAKKTGWPSFKAHLAYVPRRHEGKIVGFTIRVTPENKLPMSLGEALAIATTIHPGALFKLHQSGKPDLIALRALEVTARA